MTVLQLHGVTRHFGRRLVLKDIDLQIEKGERVALAGPNGSGKTTLLRIAAGTLRPTAGMVTTDPARIGYLPQDVPVYRELSAADHLRFVAKVRGIPWDDSHSIAQLSAAGLARMAHRPAGTLSRGQRQRLGIALAQIGDPDLLLLDEPWTALDAEGRDWLTDLLDHTDAAVLAAVHDGTPFQPDRALLLDGGRLQ